MHTIEEIRGEAMRLSAAERARLARELIESLDDLADIDQAAVDAAWADEVRRRVQELRAGNVEALSGRQVMEELRQRFTK